MVFGTFQKRCKKAKTALLQVGCMDDFISGNNLCLYFYMCMTTLCFCTGMMSRSRGQVLRVAAVMHVLFHVDTPTSIPTEITESAVRAADCFIGICLQHASYIGGRGDLQEAIDEIDQGISLCTCKILQLLTLHITCSCITCEHSRAFWVTGPFCRYLLLTTARKNPSR